MSRIRNAFNGFVTLRVDEKTSKSSNRCNIPSIHSFYLFSPAFKTNFIECSELIDQSIERRCQKSRVRLKWARIPSNEVSRSIDRSSAVDKFLFQLK